MKIEELLAAIGNGSLRFAGITHDSRKVREKYVFAAIRGSVQDGHHFVREAVGKGAACIVCEKETAAPVPVCRTESVRDWLGRLSAAIYGNPSHQQHVVGVTGSNGKTTIAAMVQSFFLENGIPCGLIGTVENDINGVRTPAALTTPEAPDLQKMLSDLAAAGTRHAVMEVSAQGVEMGRIEGTRFSIGIFTNLTPDHLDFHRSMDAYANAKKRFMKSLSPDKTGIYNADDPVVRQAVRESPCRVFTYSLRDPAADLSVQSLELRKSGSRFFVKASPRLQAATGGGIESIPFWIPLPGLHNVSNALAALLAGGLSGLPPFVMRRALQKFQPVTRRMQVFEWRGIRVVDDTAMNPGSIRAVLDSFHPHDYGRIFVVFAIRGNRGETVNRENAAALAGWWREWKKSAPQLIVTSSLGHTGPNDRVSPPEEAVFLGTLSQNGVPCTFCPELPDAIYLAANAAAAGDLLFLLGAQGMDEGGGILSQMRKIKDLVK